MSIFSKLFGSLFGNKKSIDDLLSELDKAQKNSDYVQIAKLYYDIGEKYLKEGKEEKAFVYINRFDNLTGSDDTLCKKFEKKHEQVSDWIIMLEDKPFYAKLMQDKVNELSENLSLTQKMQWILLTLTRFCTLFSKFSNFQGFEILRQYENIIDILTESMFFNLNEAETKSLSDWLVRFYDFTDSKVVYNANNQISIAGKEPFQACDFSGDLLLTNMYEALDELLQRAEIDDPDDFNMDMVTSGLLTGYYVRTSTENIRNIPAIKSEQSRIESDYEFICTLPSRDEFMKRILEYKKIMLVS